ncbi:MAG: hypothetical protein IIB19_02710 [Chloroflexi bacterium]|nr:hypothetical protein [Chloroflexota bacterium]
MAKGAVTKLKLDTTRAHRDLKELAREGEATTGRINRKGRGRGDGGSAFGKGFGAGAGFALGKKIAGSVGFFSSIGDIASDALSGIQADVDYGLGAQLSRAKMEARERTVQEYGLTNYYSDQSAATKQFYNSYLRNVATPRQEGRGRTMKIIGGARGLDEDNKTPFDKFTENAVDAIREGFEKILEKLGG